MSDKARALEQIAFLNLRNIRYEPKGALIWADTDKGTMRLCDLRGWGHLIGSGGWALDADSAEKVQDAIGHALAKTFDTHTSATSQMKPLVEALRYSNDILEAVQPEFKRIASDSVRGVLQEAIKQNRQALATIEQQEKKNG